MPEQDTAKQNPFLLKFHTRKFLMLKKKMEP